MTITIVGGGNPSGPTFPVQRSVRFRDSASAYFNRTPASAGSRTTWTWSGWVKRGAFYSTNSGPTIFSAGTDGNNFSDFRFLSSLSDVMDFTIVVSGSAVATIRTTQVFRDPSAWYHIVLALDTTQATSSERIRLYINGVRVTAFSTATYPAQNNAQCQVNATNVHYIGRSVEPTYRYMDGYMTEVNFIDGQALTPTSFGAYNSYGVWSPAKYTGTYGTNGFYLNFQDNSGATATTIGKDSSGNNNNWTPNNISVTAGVTYDSMTDVPTLTSNTNANFCTGNPLNADGSTWSGGNLNFSLPNSTNNAQGTMSVTSGKWYWEVVYSANPTQTGVQEIGLRTRWTSGVVYASDGTKYVNGTNSSYGASYTNGDIIGVALDMTGGTVTFYKNNTSQGAISLTGSGCVNATFTTSAGGGLTSTGSVNFGQRPFSYTPPTGFQPLNTFNLPPPSIPNGALYMAATTYAGTGAANSGTTQDISASFQPDFLWIKNRTSGSANNVLVDSIRGNYSLSTNNTAADVLNGNQLLLSNGYRVAEIGGSGNIAYNPNLTGNNYVGWIWKANGTPAVTNTSGSIPSTISANTTSGFSIVTYTGTGANATVGHGLGVAPRMILTKSRSAVQSWYVYHVSIGGTKTLYLNLTDAAGTDSRIWNNTDPTSSVFSIGTVGPNASAVTQVAYCFSEIAGFSKFGSYVGNGSADGPFIYTGFRPRWVMIKSSTGVESWYVYDSSRNTYNVADSRLYPNLSAAEGTGGSFGPDLLSNGFKPRTSDSSINLNGGTYIYAAFAENPFNYSLAR